MVICTDYNTASSADYELVAQVLNEYGVAWHRNQGGAMPLVITAPGGGPSLADLVQTALKLGANASLPVFYFGHGQKAPPAFIGRSNAIVLGKKDWPLLIDRVVCATACYSADRLGAEIRKFGASLLGHRGPLFVPTSGPAVGKMRKAALAGPSALLRGEPLERARQAAINAYKELSEELIASRDPGDTVLAAYMGYNQDSVAVVGDKARKI